jgi:GntR family transcriptional regulator
MVLAWNACYNTTMTATSVTFSREQGSPLHHQVYLTLRDSLGSGRYRPGDPLSTEETMAAEFGVSRITLRRALDTLAREGLVERRQGIGTFVGKGTTELMGLPFIGIKKQTERLGQTTSAQVVEFGSVVPPRAIGEMFKLSPGEKLQRAVRIRLRDGVPIFHLTTYVANHVSHTYSRKDLERRPLFELIKRAGVTIASGHQIVTATLAGPPIAQRLDLKIGEPLLRIIRVLNDLDQQPIEHLDIVASAKNLQLRFALESGAQKHFGGIAVDD